MKRTAAFAAACLALATPCVAYYEGMVPRTYVDPVGIPTACYGHTGADVTPGRTFTAGECAQLLSGDLDEAYAAVEQCVSVPIEAHEAAALVSFTFNVGGTAFCRSTMTRLINAGAPASTWCAQLSRWTKATKLGLVVELPGLVKRRAAERAMCEGRDSMAGAP